MDTLATYMTTPANTVISIFGGVRPLARLLVMSPGAIAKWRKNGLIPSKHHARLMDLARSKRRRLTERMLVRGA